MNTYYNGYRVTTVDGKRFYFHNDTDEDEAVESYGQSYKEDKVYGFIDYVKGELNLIPAKRIASLERVFDCLMQDQAMQTMNEVIENDKL